MLDISKIFLFLGLAISSLKYFQTGVFCLECKTSEWTGSAFQYKVSAFQFWSFVSFVFLLCGCCSFSLSSSDHHESFVVDGFGVFVFGKFIYIFIVSFNSIYLFQALSREKREGKCAEKCNKTVACTKVPPGLDCSKCHNACDVAIVEGCARYCDSCIKDEPQCRDNCIDCKFYLLSLLYNTWLRFHIW